MHTTSKNAAYHVYEGTSKDRNLAPQVQKLLRKCIEHGGDLRLRDLRVLHHAFDYQTCVFATDSDHQVIGFVYLTVHPAKKNAKGHVSISSLMVDPQYRDSGLGKKLKLGIHKLAKDQFPHFALISISSNPIVHYINQQEKLKEISYRQLWEVYAFDIIKECEYYPLLTIRVKRNKTSKNIFDNIVITDEISGHPKHVYVRDALEHS